MNRNWFSLQRAMMALLIVTIFVGVLQMLSAYGALRFDTKDFNTAQNYALSLVDYNLQMAKEFGVPENDTRIKLLSSRIIDKINGASKADDLYQIILHDMVNFEHIIREQAVVTLTNYLRYLILQDPNNVILPDEAEITIQFLADSLVKIDGGDHLTQDTHTKIADYKLPEALRLQTIVIVVENREGIPTAWAKVPKTEVDSVLNLENQHRYLEQELRELKIQAGMAEMVGSGLTIRLSDNESRLSSEELVHDVDVYEVVHALFASGAQGITVGEKRLIATSSIRCVGGPIYVNNEPIRVQPVIISAVGDIDSLMAGLAPLYEYYVYERGLRVEIIEQDEIRLPAFSRR